MPGDGRLSGDLTLLKNATPYIDPAIYLDYLMCCPTSEVIHAFTKHEPLLTRLMEENTKLWDEVVELKEENIRLSKYNKTLETTNTYLTDENNGWIESEQISNSEIRYMKDQINELQEMAEDKQAELDRLRYTYLATVLYLAAFGVLVFSYVV
jgi:predicted RNase H-like nuclease (RuvC/YqgF family)